MSKNYTVNKITDFEIKLMISTPDDPIIDDSGKYRIAKQIITALGKNGYMIIRKNPIISYYGAQSGSPYTAKQVGNAIKDFNNMNTVFYNDIKDYYLDLLNEDIT